MVKWFFNANKERFEDIRDRMLENNNPNDRIYTLSTDNTMTKDSDSAFILYVGQYPAGQKLQLRMTLLTDAANTKEKYTIIKQFFFRPVITAR